ncbi:coxsackievirus and adenovirus receptor-like isoform X1 [Girardinichthys multiradiatus]|uniref:coxsackievirus and adenovirus receptor-like isoform X1 n=1 Tax=Girardinichthys multiradiatus TaxID=208333 RepID=UPI001FAB8D13|nr:coxsackievirus and adenovirus receptor-like isoform X1 [Girardinichthys multiradiatus]
MGIQPLNWDKASPVLQAVNFSLWDLMEALKVSPYWTVFYLALRFMERTSADSPADQKIISAKHGEEVILPCRPAENKDVVVVKWIRTDLESDQFVLLYRSKQFDPEVQSPSFKNRVDLKDVKNGNVSLVLKKVTTDDTGIYECRVQRGNNRRKRSIQDTDPISIIVLIVQPGESVCYWIRTSSSFLVLDMRETSQIRCLCFLSSVSPGLQLLSALDGQTQTLQ